MPVLVLAGIAIYTAGVVTSLGLVHTNVEGATLVRVVIFWPVLWLFLAGVGAALALMALGNIVLAQREGT